MLQQKCESNEQLPPVYRQEFKTGFSAIPAAERSAKITILSDPTGYEPQADGIYFTQNYVESHVYSWVVEIGHTIGAGNVYKDSNPASILHFGTQFCPHNSLLQHSSTTFETKIVYSAKFRFYINSGCCLPTLRSCRQNPACTGH
jgi:hypothetical protein